MKEADDIAGRSGPSARVAARLAKMKNNVVFGAALLIALGSGVTGISAQLAFAPMLVWMLGYSQEKAQGTALRFACWTSFAAVGTNLFSAVQSPGEYSPGRLLLSGVTLFVGATLGALLGVPLIPKARGVGRSRRGAMLGVVLMFLVIVSTAHQTGWSVPRLPVASTPPGLLLLGMIVGALTQTLALPGNLLLIASVAYFGGFATQFDLAGVRYAVTLALIVTGTAALIPAWGYAKRGLVDTLYSSSIVWGALLGGILGGVARQTLSGKSLLFAFALIGMFLAAREVARFSNISDGDASEAKTTNDPHATESPE